MPDQLVPAEFEVPLTFEGPGFHLEPLDPVHNERDYQAWMLSIDHIRSTPGMGWKSWPNPMSLKDNMKDMVMHAHEFTLRESFTYSILDGDLVIGCVYIYPCKHGHQAHVRSWVTESRSDMDPVVWESLSQWLDSEWPFDDYVYEARG